MLLFSLDDNRLPHQLGALASELMDDSRFEALSQLLVLLQPSQAVLSPLTLNVVHSLATNIPALSHFSPLAAASASVASSFSRSASVTSSTPTMQSRAPALPQSAPPIPWENISIANGSQIPSSSSIFTLAGCMKLGRQIPYFQQSFKRLCTEYV